MLGVGLAACAPEPTIPLKGDRVVFELGGDGARLAEVLRAGGLSASAAASPAPAPDPAPEPDAKATPAARPPPVRSAVLREGETLYDVCRNELGDGSRWPEVMKLNGLTEPQLRRLKVGTRIELPPE
jgi:hypothetical protein